LSAFDASNSFNSILNLFKQRNKGAERLGIIAVPTPFTSIKQIVDRFAADVASKMH
jgi:hypothetical protein